MLQKLSDTCNLLPHLLPCHTIRQIIDYYLLTLLCHALECFLEHLQPLRTILPCYLCMQCYCQKISLTIK